MAEEKIKVGILGATGMVGQRFVTLLANHPWFELHDLVASEKSAGQKYEKAVEGRWYMSVSTPQKVKDMIVKKVGDKLESKVLFSALDSSIAGEIEEEELGHSGQLSFGGRLLNATLKKATFGCWNSSRFSRTG